ncbi:MAG: SDR family NAD(P)-dependent oxidoreductase [Anaerolineales bacterium]|nr:SDR family NAD(P)-dependent oxidoreductase [Anaerolineales bacterium]
MKQKVCIITGGNSGIGKAAAIQIAQQGHKVIIACRSQPRGEEALADIRQQANSNNVELMLVDMSLQSSIRAFAQAFLARYEVLDVLIQNAAVFDIRQKKIEFTSEDVESVWATNHVGPVLLTELLLDALKRSEQGRIITISSKGLISYPFLKVNLTDPEFREGKFSVQKAYYQSKQAQVMYTYWLAKTLQDTAVTANSIRVTNVRLDVEKRYPDLPVLLRKMYAFKSKFAITPDEMAQTYTFLALAPGLAQTSGKYYDDPTHIVDSSAYTHDWQNIEKMMQVTRRFIKQPEIA